MVSGPLFGMIVLGFSCNFHNERSRLVVDMIRLRVCEAESAGCI